MTKKLETIKTEWGSKQVVVPDMFKLTRNQEVSLRQEWATPQNFWDVLNAEFEFDIDVAASIDNTLCRNYISAYEDALSDKARWIRPGEMYRH